MNSELNQSNSVITYIFELKLIKSIEEVKSFMSENSSPYVFNCPEPRTIRFEWFLDENEKTGTLIEIFEDSKHWEELGGKVLGSPIFAKLNELFKIEKTTVLGDISEAWKTKIQALNPIHKTYIGGIN